MIVEYKFHRVKGGKGRTSVPSFIVDGGYFSEGSKYVGIAANDGTYIPSTLVVLDRASLITKLTNIGYTIRDDLEDRLATAEEIEATVDTFISEHDI
tara:strand:- start:11 stop:301 length:291 start_codon:yes stop_codon:yes gene_type:complete